MVHYTEGGNNFNNTERNNYDCTCHLDDHLQRLSGKVKVYCRQRADFPTAASSRSNLNVALLHLKPHPLFLTDDRRTIVNIPGLTSEAGHVDGSRKHSKLLER